MSSLSKMMTKDVQLDTENATDQTILIVDDNESERLRMVLLMERLGLCPIYASDGEEALEMAKRHHPGIIISDWYMPGMSGLELCKALRETEYGADVYFILVTGEDRQQHLAKGLSEGADDFLTKPYMAEEIRARVTAGKRALKSRKKLETSNNDLRAQLVAREKSETRIKDNLASAAELQSRMLPLKNSVLGGFKVGHVSRTAEDLAGDVFGCILFNQDGDIGFFHVDVVGHGVVAAMNSFSVARLLCSANAAKSFLTTDDKPSPAHMVVERLNEYFNSDEECDQYFTMVYGVLNSKTGEGQLCQAGHPHPLIITPDGEARRLGKGGLPVGLMEFARYESVNFTMDPGDRLFLYSDGAVEAENERGEQLGFLSLSRRAVAQRELPLQSWLEDLESQVVDWTGSENLEDDMSMMGLERIKEVSSKPLEIQ